MKPRIQEYLTRPADILNGAPGEVNAEEINAVLAHAQAPRSLFSIPTNITAEDVEAARERDRAFLHTYKP